MIYDIYLNGKEHETRQSLAPCYEVVKSLNGKGSSLLVEIRNRNNGKVDFLRNLTPSPAILKAEREKAIKDTRQEIERIYGKPSAKGRAYIGSRRIAASFDCTILGGEIVTKF